MHLHKVGCDLFTKTKKFRLSGLQPFADRNGDFMRHSPFMFAVPDSVFGTAVQFLIDSIGREILVLHRLPDATKEIVDTGGSIRQ